MTPADRAMKAALDESVRYADSLPALAPGAHPLLGHPPHPNVTSLESHVGKTLDPVDISSRPTTPHVTLHQFHKLQHSPVPSSPDADYKRVRRKPSFASLIRLPPDSSRLPAPFTSSQTLLHSKSSRSLLPSLLPPLPLTPVPRSSTYSPSLSSTIDTLPSTPTHTPIQRVFWPPEPWREFEQGGLSEPIRTKRKFLPLKQAKRLPHHSAHQAKEESVWEVHAVVIDVGTGIGDLEEFEQEHAAQVRSSQSVRVLNQASVVRNEEETNRRKGRLVRFQDLENEESSSAAEDPASPTSQPRGEEENRPEVTSSSSLSNFKFPAPSGSNWEGTFGHLTYPASPTSPATLHYEGTSFDVVNPHNSLLLGVSDIETPAEIDGLLDNYFDRRSFDAMAYKDQTGEKSSSQLSLQTSASNGRQRILYDDPEDARRNIMGIPSGSSQQPITTGRSHGQEGITPPMPAWPLPLRPRPATANPFASVIPDQPRGLQIHSRLQEGLGLGAAGGSRVVANDVDYQDLNHRPEDEHYTPVSTHLGHYSPALTDAQAPRHYDDRPTSMYPHSRRSYPFDLTLSDDEGVPMYSQVDEVVAGGRTSYYASGSDHGADFTIYEDPDADDANATPTSLEPETTVGNILSHYDYPRRPLRTLAYYDPQNEDESNQSSSIGHFRGEGVTNPFLSPQDYYHERGTPQDPNSVYPDIAYGRFIGAPRPSGPPNVPVPVPGMYVEHGAGSIPYTGGFAEPYSTDQTYGSTGQLLGLTPQTGRLSTRGPELMPATLGWRGRRLDQGFEGVRTTPANTRPTPVPPSIEDGDEDKENTPPHPDRPPSISSVTPRDEAEATYYEGPHRTVGPATIVNLPAYMQQSSSAYRDDESMWESTQASHSCENLAATADEHAMELDEPGDVRPSEESYANTSVAGSNVRLSLPRPGTAVPMMPPQAVHRGWPAIVANTSNGLAPREDTFMPAPPTNGDEERATRILQDKMMEEVVLVQRYSATQRRSQDQYSSDMRELEAIRRRNPRAVEKAAQTVSEQFGKLVGVQPTYTPEASASNMPRFGFGKNTPDSRFSETKGLLAEHTSSPLSHRGLRFSETENTFKTATRMPSFLTNRPVQNYTPLSPPPIIPPAAAHLRDFINSPAPRGVRNRPSQVAPGMTESIELQPTSRRGRVSLVAMSSQTELRPLQLADSTAASGISGRMTDVQLAEASAGWTMRPDRSESNPMRPVSHRHSVLGIRQSDDINPHLMSAHDASNIFVRRVQRLYTRPYFRACIVCPITALIFGLGGLDWRIRQITSGRITEMSPTAKKQALQVYLPLGCIFYAVVALTIAILVVVTKK